MADGVCVPIPPPPPPTCEEGEEVVNGVCVTPPPPPPPTCEAGEELVNGVCVTPPPPPPPTCEAGEELVNGVCVAPPPPPPLTCEEGEELVNGVCVTPPPPPPPTCEAGEELVNGVCVTLPPPPPPTCEAGEEVVDGVCVTPPLTCEAGEEEVGGVCVPIPPPPLTCDSDPNADNMLSINERFDTLPRPCAVSVDGKIRAILLSEGGAIAIQSDLDSDVIYPSIEMRKGDQTIPDATAVFWCIAEAEGRIWHTSETNATTIAVECADPEIHVSARNTFKYWDSDENADLTCVEAYGGGGNAGLKLPAYSDRDDTDVIYDWLELETASDSVAPPRPPPLTCESNSNAGGYIGRTWSVMSSRIPTPTPTIAGGCC